jgi:hypothetical protein
MSKTRRLNAFGLAVFLLIFSMTATAQFGFGKKSNKGESAAQPVAADQAALIADKLNSQIKLTKITSDHVTIITPGDVVVLQKSGLMMCNIASAYAYSNTYDNGVLASNQKNRAKDAAISGTKNALIGHFTGGSATSAATDAANNTCVSLKFDTGDKFWVTAIAAKKDGILISTLSDPLPEQSENQIRYYGEIKFMFPKGSVPTADDFVKTVSEVITVQSAEGQGDQGGQPAAAPEAPAPVQDIAPPPPPADTPPPTIALRQTKDEVIAGFGQPTRIVKLGVKEIYYYKDMKVTFTNGKVSNVE